MKTRVAIVTGANKGIGYAIVKGLCKQFDGIVYLTARNIDLGKEAIEKLNKEGLKPNFHQLEIDKDESVKEFSNYIAQKYGGLDVLVNNAAILLLRNETIPLHEQAEKTLEINYFGTLKVCNALFPLLRPHARIVNVSSKAGLLKIIKNSDICKNLSDSNATEETISNIANEYVKATKENTHQSLFGYPDMQYATYAISKVFLTAVTIAHQRKFTNNKANKPDIIINSCCPGYCDTDMTNHRGTKTPDQGAETPVYLALLPPNINEPKGKFIEEKKVFDWENEVFDL